MYKFLVLAALVVVTVASVDYGYDEPQVYDAGYRSDSSYGYGGDYGSYGYGDAVSGDCDSYNLPVFYKKYRTTYSPDFYKCCNNYLSAHPRGRYYSIAQRYVTEYKSQYSSSSYAGHGGSYYGGAVSGDCDNYNLPVFYKKYRTTYSPDFYKCCNNYLNAHPRGRYYSIAQRYVAEYRSQYSSSSYAGHSGSYYGGAVSGDCDSYNLPVFYKKYRATYSPDFYKCCNDYLSAHPRGRYYSIARRYVTEYRSQYSSSSSYSSHGGSHYGGYSSGGYSSAGSVAYGSTYNDFPLLYKKYNSYYSPYFYKYCNDYIGAHPRSGRYLDVARKYVSTFKSQYSSSSSHYSSGSYNYGGYSGAVYPHGGYDDYSSDYDKDYSYGTSY